MKKTILAFSMIAVTTLSAQVVTPPTPARPATPAPATPATPLSPAQRPGTPPQPATPQPGTPVNPLDPSQRILATNTAIPGVSNNLAASSNNFSLGTSNTLASGVSNNLGNLGTEVSVQDMQGFLVNFQAHIEQSLPILTALTTGDGTGVLTPVNLNAAAGTVASPGVANVATPGVVPSSAGQAAVFNNANVRTAPVAPGTGSIAQRGLTPAQAQQQQALLQQRALLQGQSAVNPAFLGVLGTNTVAMSQETLQLLITLRNNLQQTLPIVQTLNASGNLTPTGIPTGQPALGFSNRFTIVTNRVNQINPARPGVVAPIGR